MSDLISAEEARKVSLKYRAEEKVSEFNSLVGRIREYIPRFSKEGGFYAETRVPRCLWSKEDRHNLERVFERDGYTVSFKSNIAFWWPDTRREWMAIRVSW